MDILFFSSNCRLIGCENAIGIMTKLQTSLANEETWVDGATEKLSALPTATSALELDVSTVLSSSLFIQRTKITQIHYTFHIYTYKRSLSISLLCMIIFYIVVFQLQLLASVSTKKSNCWYHFTILCIVNHANRIFILNLFYLCCCSFNRVFVYFFYVVFRYEFSVEQLVIHLKKIYILYFPNQCSLLDTLWLSLLCYSRETFSELLDEYIFIFIYCS